MNSNEMKTKVLHYLRFKRDYSLVATEAGRKKKNNADVLASNFEEIVEVEIKISKYDLKKDFQKVIPYFQRLEKSLINSPLVF